MFKLNYGIEEVVDIHSNKVNIFVDSINQIVYQYNYTVSKQTSTTIFFKKYGLKPIYNSEAIYYIDNGVFELVTNGEETLIQLSYNISYASEIYLIIIVLLCAFALDYWALFMAIPFLGQFINRLRKIKATANDMLTDAINLII